MMTTEIFHSNMQDIDEIFRLYSLATDFQKTRFKSHWPQFKRSLIEKEVLEQRQFKMVVNGRVACVWAITFSDPQIWEDRNHEPAVYIHRIATNPDFRGHNFVLEIVKWARDYAKENRKEYIRMDTVGDNARLIAHYEKCGFDYLGLFKLFNTDDLPAHYHNATVSLFQIEL